MSIIQIDAPLHDLEDWRVFSGQLRATHAVGYLARRPVTITPDPDGQYRVAYFVGLMTGGAIRATLPSFAQAEAIVKAAQFFHDPAVCFIQAADGPTAAREILENAA